MKQFLAFLLIAIVACTTVEDMTLQNWIDTLKELFNKGVQWLKDHGVYDQVVQALRTLGKQAAIEVCCNWLDRTICEAVLSFL